MANSSGTTVLRYLAHAGNPTDTSTFIDLIDIVEDATLKDTIMTYAEQLKQQGREEGRLEGTLIGKIQHCQQLLNLPVAEIQSLQDKPQPELNQLLQDLETTLRQKLHSTGSGQASPEP